VRNGNDIPGLLGIPHPDCELAQAVGLPLLILSVALIYYSLLR